MDLAMDTETDAPVSTTSWKARSLDEGVLLLSGHHVLAKFCNEDGEGTPYLTGPADFPNGQIKHSKYTVRGTTLCSCGDILVTVKGSGSGSLVIADGEYAISRQLMAIRVTDWDPRFVYYSLLHGSSEIEAAATGLIPGLSRSDILNSKILLPNDLEEQRAVSLVLSDTDALISSLEKLIEKKRNIKQGAMQELLTGKRRLPGFSENWSKYTFGDLFEFLPTANNSRSDLTPDGETGYVHYGDIHTHSSPFLDCTRDSLTAISSFKVKNIPRVEEGDLIVADASEDYAGIGKTIEVRNLESRHIVAGLHTFLLRGSKTKLANKFKAYLQFIPSVRTALVRMATGISVFGISKNNMRTIALEIPSIQEQEAIAKILTEMEAEIETLLTKLQKARFIKQGMMQNLLTGKIRLI